MPKSVRSPRNLFSVLESLQNAAHERARRSTDEVGRRGKYQENNMLKVKVKRFANRTHVIDSTIFKFDEHGVASVEDVGNNRVAYEQILKMNGASPVVEAPVVIEEAPVPEVPVVAEEPSAEVTSEEEEAPAQDEPSASSDTDTPDPVKRKTGKRKKSE